MKNKKKLVSLMALAELSLTLLTGCGERKWPMQVTVVNRTTCPIADIRLSLASEEDWGPNRIETVLEEGESVEIDLGEYTEEELNAGFNLQFYGEDDEPVNPDYEASNPIFFDNGDYFILAPADISVAVFMDTSYDAVDYDQKIMEYYDAEDDGRGDLIPDEGEEEDGRGDLISDEETGDGGTIPVLIGGLPFTNMENMQTDNNSDGTYYYADITGDGQIIVVNTVQESSLQADTQNLKDYLTACALALAEAEDYEIQTAYEDDSLSANMSYPVYVISFVAGGGEDVRQWTVFAMDTDSYTYLYGFCATLDGAEDMEEVYQNIFMNLYLSEEAMQ